jgi:hypothetical protein
MGRIAWVALVLLVGCAREGSRGTPGTERADCRAGSNSCDTGMLCLSNVCVRPPAAACKDVAEGLASLDLGNYAEAEERAPVVAKYQTACEKARVSKEEGECLDKATDKWTAGQCVPRMFPEMASSNNGDCKKVVARIESALKGQVQGLENPQMKQWYETTLKVMEQSCVEDSWPDGLKKCILTTEAAPGQDTMQQCNQQMPPALQTKFQQRLTSAMQQLQQ